MSGTGKAGLPSGRSGPSRPGEIWGKGPHRSGRWEENLKTVRHLWILQESKRMFCVHSDGNWFTIRGLDALGLIRPILIMVGVSQNIGHPLASLALIVLITIVGLAVAVRARFSRPIVTLTL